MSEVLSNLVPLLVVGLATAFVRAVPYLLFGGKRALPETVSFLGDYLPPAIMVILVVYCLRNINFAVYPHGLAEFISVAVTGTMQYWKKNIILSIIAGTACYMLLIRTAFPA